MRRPLFTFSTLLFTALLLAAACDDGAPSTTSDTNPEEDTSPNEDTALEDATTAEDAEVEIVEEPLLELPPRPWSVESLGGYHVGYRQTYIRYIPEGETEERSLRVAIWYPTRQLSGKPVAYSLIFPRPNTVIREPTPALDDGPLPVMLFSHGSISIAEQSYFLTEFFASHGWLVIAPDHTGNTLADNQAGPLPPDLFLLRPRDITATLDAMLALDTEDPLSGALSDDIIVSGHSFGGYTALSVAGAVADVPRLLGACDNPDLDLFCDFVPFVEANQGAITAGFHDPRVDLVIPMSPGATRLYEGGIDDIDIPVLLMTADRDKTTTDAAEGDPTWAELDGPTDLRVRIANGGHFTFSHLCDLVPEAALEDGCGEDFTPPEEVFPAINAYALAFARKHLFGDTSNDALLNGETSLHSDITLELR